MKGPLATCSKQKVLVGLITSWLCLGIPQISLADTTVPAPGEQNGESAALKKIETYLKNFGTYLGFKLDEKASTNPTATAFIDNPSATWQNAFQTFINMNIDPSTAKSKETSTGSGYSLSNGMLVPDKNIDVTPWQADPVSQALLDLISTPNGTYETPPATNTNPLKASLAATTTPSTSFNIAPSLQAVQATSLGELNPSNTDFQGCTTETCGVIAAKKLFKDAQTKVLELNSDSLLMPTQYTTISVPSANGGAATSLDQATIADKFIRYVIGSSMPPPMPTQTQLNSIYTSSHTGLNSLASYLSNMRAFAAQRSVAISNFYYVLGKRLPDPTTKISQEMYEYQMATWRLSPPSTGSTSWADTMNQASSATVGKEIATLLAEINYQLYLTRQQQERLLMTNSILLIVNGKMTMPDSTNVGK
ncbi:MAG: hypothetical protein Q8R79_05715 [Legionellaceae bacterium]|nr:hypothetical protein [Legionellaceae bacterium]